MDEAVAGFEQTFAHIDDVLKGFEHAAAPKHKPALPCHKQLEAPVAGEVPGVCIRNLGAPEAL